MRCLLAILLALGLGLSIFMIVAPLAWYGVLPGVAETGPANAHFIRDIGCAYLMVAASLVWLIRAPERAWPAMLAGGGFLALHGLIHVRDAFAGHGDLHHLLAEAPTIFLPAGLVLGLALSRAPCAPRARSSALLPPSSPPRKAGRGALAWIVGRRLEAFERDFGYDASYVREIAGSGLVTLLRFLMFNGFAAQRAGLSPTPLFAAKLASALAEDCGPCTQLVVTMAEREGVSTTTLVSLLAGRPQDADPDASLAFRFASAVLRHELTTADPLRAEVLSRWGQKGLVSLAFALSSARVFPTLKYALGHGKACSRVRVAGRDTALAVQ